jgi:CheY-like chemotaxis protein
MFLETEADLPIGSEVSLKLAVPGAGIVNLSGTVAWHRGSESLEGPAGIGVEFLDLGPDMGMVIDHLVGSYQGITVLLLAPDRQDRTSLTRVIRSILGTAEVVSASDAQIATTMLTGDVDVAVIDVDADPEGAFHALRQAKQADPSIPSIALASTKRLREQSKLAGADEVASNPPQFQELQVLLVRALGRPLSVTNQPR